MAVWWSDFGSTEGAGLVVGGLTTTGAAAAGGGKGGGGGGEGGDGLIGESTGGTGGEDGAVSTGTRGGSDCSLGSREEGLLPLAPPTPLFCLRPLTILEKPSSGRAGGGGGGGGVGILSVVGNGGKLLDARSSLGAGGGRGCCRYM